MKGVPRGLHGRTGRWSRRTRTLRRTTKLTPPRIRQWGTRQPVDPQGGVFAFRATVFDADDLRRAHTRIAHEIVERNHGADRVVLAGLYTRGLVIAHRLAAAIAEFEAVDVPVGALDVAFYRDDIGIRPVQPLGPTEFPVDITGTVVVLVDDVLYTGRTVRAALDALHELGRPQAVQLAILVDRGHRELPIRPDFVGKNLPTQARRGRSRPAGRDRRRRARTPSSCGAPRRPAAHDDRDEEAAAMKHLLGIDGLERADLEHLLELSEHFLEVTQRDIPKVPALRGKVVVSLFYEDSTRTRISFETAAKRLSCDVMSFSVGSSSVQKGESLRDTVQTIEAMGIDALVLRHGSAGAPALVANWVDACVLNAGDGCHEHPTQALLDALTLRRHLGPDLDGLRLAIVGDILHSRVARSDVLAFAALGAEVTLVAPPTLLPPVARRLAGAGEPRPRRRARRRRRDPAAPHPARTPQRVAVPEPARVHRALRPHRRACRRACARTCS